MRELRKSRDKYLPPVKLFLDDVLQIEHILTKDNGQTSLNVTTSDYELDNSKELLQINRSQIDELHFNLLELPSNKPLITLDIEPQGVRVHTDDLTTNSRGMMDTIEGLLYPNRRRISLLPEPRVEAFIPLMVLLIGTLCSVGSVVVFNIKGLAQLLLLAGVGIVLLLASLGLMAHGFRVRSEIVLKRRSEQESLWKRKSDDIILVIVTAALTFVATLLGTWAAGILQLFR